MKFLARLLRRWYRTIPQNETGRLLWGKYFRRLALKLIAWFLGLSIGFTLLYAVVPVPITPLMLVRCWEQAWASNRSVRLDNYWVPFSDLSPHLQLAVVCSEDQYFLEHSGFDLLAIEKAYSYNQKHERKRGASTGLRMPCGAHLRLGRASPSGPLRFRRRPGERVARARWPLDRAGDRR